MPLNATPMFAPQVAPLGAGIEMAAYEQAWKPMKPWLGNTMTTGSIRGRAVLFGPAKSPTKTSATAI